MNLVHDKFQKSLYPVLEHSSKLVDKEGIKISPHTSQSEELLSEIYIFIQKELLKQTDIMIGLRSGSAALSKTSKTNLQDLAQHSDTSSAQIHEDLLQGYLDERLDRSRFFDEFLNSESPTRRQLNLCLEYESLDLRVLANERYQDLLLKINSSSTGRQSLSEKNVAQTATERNFPHSPQTTLKPNLRNSIVGSNKNVTQPKASTNAGSELDEIWYQYCLFRLRKLDYLEAEEALWTAISHAGASIPEYTDDRDFLAHPESQSTSDLQATERSRFASEATAKLDPFKKVDVPEYIMNYKTIMVCFYLQRGKVNQAKHLVLHLLTINRLSTLLNTLMSFIYFYYV